MVWFGDPFVCGLNKTLDYRVDYIDRFIDSRD